MLDRQAQLLGTEVRKADSVSNTLKRFATYFRPYTLALLLVLVALIGSTWMQVRIPYLMGQAVDCYLGPYVSQASFGGNSGPSLPEGLSDIISQQAGEQTNAFANCTYTSINLDASFEETLAGFTGLILLIVALYVASADTR